MRILKVLALLLAFALPLRAQSVVIGTAHEEGHIPRHDVYTIVSAGPLTAEFHEAARLGYLDRFGQVTYRTSGPIQFGGFVGGGTSQFAMFPTRTAGLLTNIPIPMGRLEVTTFGQTNVDKVNLAGVTEAANIDIAKVSLGLVGTVTTDKDTRSISPSVTWNGKNRQLGVYGMAGSEVYWNPPREVHQLREVGVTGVATIIPFVDIMTNLGVGTRQGRGYGALRTSLKISR
jgi:hypothetical protein